MLTTKMEGCFPLFAQVFMHLFYFAYDKGVFMRNEQKKAHRIEGYLQGV